MDTTQPKPEMIAAWQLLPNERTTAFLTAFGAVARAVQQTLRERVPTLYFRDTCRYENLESALPMLVYQYSRPVSRRQKRELAYDVLCASMMRSFFWSAEQDLPNGLAALETRMRETGNASLPAIYAPSRFRRIIAYARGRRVLLHRLLASEEKLLRDLANFAAELPLCRRPQTAYSRLLKRWRFTLARFYPSVDASALAEELLEIATNALISTAPSKCEFSDAGNTTLV
jgi:hypothetical protein